MDEYDARALERIAAMTDIQPNGCQLFTGCKITGYGQLQYRGRKTPAHRLKYELLLGAIPAGMVIDHICHDPLTCPGGDACLHRACLNVEHMQVTTQRENLSPRRRNMEKIGTSRTPPAYCPNGHEYTEENTVFMDRKRRVGRMCRTCRNAKCLERYYKRQLAKSLA